MRRLKPQVEIVSCFVLTLMMCGSACPACFEDCVCEGYTAPTGLIDYDGCTSWTIPIAKSHSWSVDPFCAPRDRDRFICPPGSRPTNCLEGIVGDPVDYKFKIHSYQGNPPPVCATPQDVEGSLNQGLYWGAPPFPGSMTLDLVLKDRGNLYQDLGDYTVSDTANINIVIPTTEDAWIHTGQPYTCGQGLYGRGDNYLMEVSYSGCPGISFKGLCQRELRIVGTPVDTCNPKMGTPSIGGDTLVIGALWQDQPNVFGLDTNAYCVGDDLRHDCRHETVIEEGIGPFLIAYVEIVHVILVPSEGVSELTTLRYQQLEQ